MIRLEAEISDLAFAQFSEVDNITPINDINVNRGILPLIDDTCHSEICGDGDYGDCVGGGFGDGEYTAGCDDDYEHDFPQRGNGSCHDLF